MQYGVDKDDRNFLFFIRVKDGQDHLPSVFLRDSEKSAFSATK